ncbi:protoheme IX farnesyltransferase [Marinomonas ushuaiensis DSM 15871]|uniref:Protoheme IX farnesyltransferase n=1 Tax=Marinomonas ushuaiensis DSM 15871 TaxID=1122207 RepID=X7EAR7_9GAMM|nr:heme o synthase [Marinomonas ushuaiensis]ETX12218.1 protoheme IX farnesyltransferase [Marinomonas ushuaiensis DSM 15871]
MFKDYVSLTKPGIIFGNLIAAASGFFLAAKGNIDWFLLLIVLIGTACIVACGCIINNYVDRDIDLKMSRTKDRALAQGRVSVSSALILSLVLGAIGFALLHVYTTVYAVLFGVIGIVVYVGLYTLKYKRNSVYGTLVGSLSGACPPVMGYVSVSNGFDVGAAILLLTFCFWQIPHSYAIAISRFDDYKAANIPVLPVKYGIQTARYHMYVYIVAFAIAALMLFERGFVGVVYALVISLMSIYWIYLVKAGYNVENEQAWGRKLFVFSIIVVTVFSVLISVDYVNHGQVEVALLQHSQLAIPS